MLHIVNLEEIQGLLQQASVLVNLQDKKSPDFVIQVRNWLVTIEDVLQRNRMPAASKLAVYRGQLIAADRGVIPPGIALIGAPTVRRVKEATAGELIRLAEALVWGVIEADQKRVAECEQVARQLVTIATFKKLIPLDGDRGSRSQYLNAVWHALLTDPDLQGGAIHMQTLVGPADALIILDRIMTLSLACESLRCGAGQGRELLP
jgi:hypothetical protein